ncbi:hypothetical protein [Sphingosinicella sp.]|uniref:hypothetical protein n=1 Tax=Sphingosinicella sp. TaxID=1917971 RepID=UPI0025CE8EC2|nr:hypothetical protein [Sphingosinicella sp.]
MDIGDGKVPDTLCLQPMAQREMFGLLYFEPRTETVEAAVQSTCLLMLAENIGLALVAGRRAA